MKLELLLGLFLFQTFAFGVPLFEDIKNSSNEIPDEITTNLDKCFSQVGINGIINCAAYKFLKFLEKADKFREIQVISGITLANENPQREGKEFTNEKNEALPTDPQQKTSKLLDLVINATYRFFSGRTLKINLSKATPENLGRSMEEGRAKMKKMMGSLMWGIGAKLITVVPIMLGGVALLASKALVVGKVALIISFILFIQTFFNGRNIIPYNNGFGGYGSYSGYGNSYGAYGTNNIGGWGTSAPYARSIDIVKDE